MSSEDSTPVAVCGTRLVSQARDVPGLRSNPIGFYIDLHYKPPLTS